MPAREDVLNCYRKDWKVKTWSNHTIPWARTSWKWSDSTAISTSTISRSVPLSSAKCHFSRLFRNRSGKIIALDSQWYRLLIRSISRQRISLNLPSLRPSSSCFTTVCTQDAPVLTSRRPRIWQERCRGTGQKRTRGALTKRPSAR